MFPTTTGQAFQSGENVSCLGLGLAESVTTCALKGLFDLAQIFLPAPLITAAEAGIRSRSYLTAQHLSISLSCPTPRWEAAGKNQGIMLLGEEFSTVSC